MFPLNVHHDYSQHCRIPKRFTEIKQRQSIYVRVCSLCQTECMDNFLRTLDIMKWTQDKRGRKNEWVCASRVPRMIPLNWMHYTFTGCCATVYHCCCCSAIKIGEEPTKLQSNSEKRNKDRQEQKRIVFIMRLSVFLLVFILSSICSFEWDEDMRVNRKWMELNKNKNWGERHKGKVREREVVILCIINILFIGKCVQGSNKTETFSH